MTSGEVNLMASGAVLLEAEPLRAADILSDRAEPSIESLTVSPAVSLVLIDKDDLHSHRFLNCY